MGLRYLTVDAVIPDGTALSQIFDTGGQLVVGLQMPGTWAAAGITFLGSHLLTGGTMRSIWLRDGSAEFLDTAPLINEFRQILPTELMLARRLQIQSGTTAVQVNQAGGTTVTVVLLAE